MSVGTRLKVLVSCIKRAVKTRFTDHLVDRSGARPAQYRLRIRRWVL
jgi:hypothetical protein